MNDTEKKAIAEQFLTGLRNRNWESLRAIMADDIVWSLPGGSVISGTAKGIEAVIKRAQTIVSYGLTFTLQHILIGQDGVALSRHNTAQHGDLVLDEYLATVFGLRDGKISTTDSCLADVSLVNVFFVK